MARVRVGAGCWVWTGARNTQGYGVIFLADRRLGKAHRVSYEHHVGPIAPGLVLLHTCDNPSCVNPAHLRPGTVAENNADKKAKGRAFTPHPRGTSHHAARVLRFRGVVRCIAEWAAVVGLKASTIRKRLNRGWPVRRALTEAA